MKQIELTQNNVTLVDDGDYDFLNQHKWHCSPKRDRSQYACRVIKQKPIRMHNIIMNPPEGYVVDHINGDGLDNRRENLRICKDIENRHNRRKLKKTISSFKGVTFRKERPYGICVWKARITVNNKLIHIGYFKTEKEAANAYNRMAIKNYGQYALLNKI